MIPPSVKGLHSGSVDAAPPPPPQIITARAVMIHVEQAVIFCIVSWAYQAICVLLSFV